MKPTIEILGSGSRIAKNYCKKNNNRIIFEQYSNSNIGGK